MLTNWPLRSPDLYRYCWVDLSNSKKGAISLLPPLRREDWQTEGQASSLAILSRQPRLTFHQWGSGLSSHQQSQDPCRLLISAMILPVLSRSIIVWYLDSREDII